jgi:hypothetical protein
MIRIHQGHPGCRETAMIRIDEGHPGCSEAAMTRIEEARDVLAVWRLP